jgi:hypothetical protein
VKGFTWTPVGGQKQRLELFPINHPRYSFVRIPSKDGVLTFELPKEKPVDLSLGSVATKGFGFLNDITKVSDKMGPCR